MLARVHASVVRERTFVSDASHELRSPLAVLRTELELIARERPSGRALEAAIGSAVEETDRLRRIADDLLTLARADDRQLEIQRSAVPAVDLLRDAAERTPRGAITVTVDAPTALWVEADTNWIGQALDNLIANALRYARAVVQLSAVGSQNGVELHVIDDGPGFPADFLPHAWERFARADTARTEEGAGLGLSIVQTIAELHGGRAHAANRPEGGADVWIALPEAVSETATEKTPAAVNRQGGALSPSASSQMRSSRRRHRQAS
jgi:signal transduction histidine kinase